MPGTTNTHRRINSKRVEREGRNYLTEEKKKHTHQSEYYGAYRRVQHVKPINLRDKRRLGDPEAR